MTAPLDVALATARAELLQAREELAQQPARSFQDAFLEALRGPYEQAAASQTPAGGRAETRWRRKDLRSFLSAYFPQYAQHHEAFAALCASLAQGADSDVVVATFDALKRVLARQFCSTRLAAKDPFPLEPCAENRPAESRPTGPPVPTGPSVHDNGSNAAATLPETREFQADVLKKSQSWLGRWRTRHLVLRWGLLEMHKRTLAVRSFRHAHSSASSASTTANSEDSVSTLSAAANAGTKRYDLGDLVAIKLEKLNDGDSTRKTALTLQFKTLLAQPSNSLSNPTPTASHDIKTLVLGGGGSNEAPDLLVSVRNHVATFALFLELSRRDRTPSMTQVRRFVEAGAQVNARVHIPRGSLSRDSSGGMRRQSSSSKQVLMGTVTALQLAFLQDPGAPGFESLIVLLLKAGANPRSLLHWEYATHVFFPPPPASSTSRSGKKDNGDHRRRQMLRKRFLLRGTLESDEGVTAAFSCANVQAEDGVRWNLLMFYSWHADVESVQRLINLTGIGSSQGIQGRMSNRQMLTCLDDVNAAGDTALHIAIKGNSEPVALLIVETALATSAQAVHQCDARGEPVVHLALTARQWRVVDALIAGGAVDPRSYDASGNSALHLAIQLRAPVALIARLIQIYRHSPPKGGLDGRAGRRGSNDTPLSLALKSGQQEVVALLLASGASPAGSDCHWSTAFKSKHEDQSNQDAEGKCIIGDDDSALHVSIKAGMELAAAALIAHKADIYSNDSRGASTLALAIRHGLYTLAAELAEQHSKKQHKQPPSKLWWVDGETGRPVVMLAAQAGQLELAALLLDYSSQDKQDDPWVDHSMNTSRTLSLLTHIIVWLDANPSSSSRSNLSTRSSGQDHQEEETECAKTKKIWSSSSTWTRDRSKSRSDGDWKNLRRDHGGSVSYSRGREDPIVSRQERTACSFLLYGIQGLVLRFLQLSPNHAAAVADSAVSQSTLPLQVRLPTIAITSAIPPKARNVDEKTTPLHVAASGGHATSKVLQLLLAFLLGVDPSAAAQVLMRPMGPGAETPLHVALAAGAGQNALLLLYSSRELEARSPATSRICSHLYEMPNLLGDSALHLASAQPRNAAILLVVELLLEQNVDAGVWNNSGLAPLHVALQQGCDGTLIELFLRYGQDLNLWTEGSATRYSGVSDSGPNAITLAPYPQNALMLAVVSENAVAFRALVRGGARTRALMPHARIGLLQLAVHCGVHNPELLAWMLDDLELERSAQSEIMDQWGVSPRDARSRLTEIWRRERSRANNEELPENCCLPSEDRNDNDKSQLGNRPPPLHLAPAHDDQVLSKASFGNNAGFTVQPGISRVPPPLRITGPQPALTQIPLETTQYLRALPHPPALSPPTLEYLREEERATLTLVAHEARSEAQTWLAKRIGQKKLLSDAHAHLQHAKKHRRSASGSSVSSAKDDVVTTTSENRERFEFAQNDQQLLEALKATAAKIFVDKHVAEVVAEVRLAIEREKQTIFQETGLYPGAPSKKSNKTSSSRHRSLLVRAASSTTGSMLLPALSASVTSMSSEEGTTYQPSEDGNGGASFWWSERGTTFLSDDNLTWLSTSGPRGGTMLSDSGAISGGGSLDSRDDRHLWSFIESEKA